MVKTTDCGSVMRGFESHYPPIKNAVTIVTAFFILCDWDENHKSKICLGSDKPEQRHDCKES